ncbi:UbiA prenyltransferase family [Penicillium malachiteum]|uniref:UbiA prenyltransferase family n=1 Tax=Penicillium malachiteum TaxID=1324776 RepID=A0AAD6HU43_9EURO|nr:UbiA prenyltransferase family [Penicillium malachiteum]
MTLLLLDQATAIHGAEQEPKESKHALPKYEEAKFIIIDAVTNFISIFWLFTESDFFTFISPVSAFGILGALSGPLLLQNAYEPSRMLRRAPLVLIYNWSNSFIFALANQRLPESVEEDRLNKPRRPLPSGRMTPLGPWDETSLLFTLNWMYNDLGGGDEGEWNTAVIGMQSSSLAAIQ